MKIPYQLVWDLKIDMSGYIESTSYDFSRIINEKLRQEISELKKQLVVSQSNLKEKISGDS